MSRTFNAKAKAKDCWKPLPDWVESLAAACDVSGLRVTAARLEVSPALVSLTIGNLQRSTEFIEPRVRDRIMAPLCACPVMGLIQRSECLTEQTAPLVTTNALRVEMYRACRDHCPHFEPRKGEKNHVARGY